MGLILDSGRCPDKALAPPFSVRKGSSPVSIAMVRLAESLIGTRGELEKLSRGLAFSQPTVEAFF